MKRRNFLKMMAAGSASVLMPSATFGKNLFPIENDSELSYHKLDRIKFSEVQLKYPRLVGKNSRLGVHGTGPKLTFCTLTTDKGANGLGLLRSGKEKAQELFASIKGKSVAELFSPSQGTLSEQHYAFDFCFHDLGGVILNKPVYELIGGNKKPIVTKCYSGMIYFDEMEPEDNPSGLGKVLENCRYDYDYGYRQLKVKIGRGGKWMSKEDGLKTDIAVTQMIHEHFPDCDILVDGNDAFTIDYFISYLKGIEDIPLFWIEEPFRETREDYAKLKEWLVDNGRRNTFLADGEANPDLKLALELGKEKLLDVYLDDISGYGFTRWRKLAPQLKAIGMMASPHAWGDTVKSFYITHYAGAYGNTPTIEGVTCFSDDVDLSAYQLKRGRIVPPALPGF
ncbi:MAG: mandelate racemase/muconate lactonizing enzyme family protein, partial [Prevotellaceae bacterium]|nr:mandelate racemase/muconate lactonizing enzyme family protein [Prevotellaceae bacterium]